jgi:hypothetical protein
MGLFSKLQNGDTVLKSLKFGNDRPGGGNSGQPYIQDPIPLVNSPANTDFILRGGINAPLSAAQDVARLTKYMFNPKSPSGLLFTAKQNLLSRISPKTEASKGIGYAGGVLNNGIYTPLSTLAQAGVGFLGGHINKQGLDPTGLIPTLSINKYEDIIGEQSIENFEKTNRLINIFSGPTKDLNGVKGYDINQGQDIITYDGGPNSILGVGKTHIKYADQRTGINNPKSLPISKTHTPPTHIITNLIGPDFREKLNPTGTPQNTYLSRSPNYVTDNIEINSNLNSPGQKGNISSYTKGKILEGDTKSKPLDTINASYIYKSEGKGQLEAQSAYAIRGNELKDIIPFYVAILNNDRQEEGKTNTYKKYMHFRAFIDSFSDSYDAEWKTMEYMGRAEKFYKYSGFDRKIDLSFTVVAQSRGEITAMYDKLNFLASSLAPEYLDSYSSGYMAGNIAYITLGQYIVEQPGVITSLSFDIPEESPWEIGIGDKGGRVGNDDVRQVPHMIKVKMNFTPIHKFRVEKQKFRNDTLGTDSTRLLDTGTQRYIDQKRPSTTNYDRDAHKQLDNEIAASIARDIADKEAIAKHEADKNRILESISPGANMVSVGGSSSTISVF